MVDKATLVAAERYARTFFEGDATGHDWHHTARVRRNAECIAAEEGANREIVALAALLHDVDDAKLSPETSDDLAHAQAFLSEQGLDADTRAAVLTAIREVSFSKNGAAQPSTLEAACVRDADRLDALGAIGVARAFAYGGARGRALHDPDATDTQATTQHFHDKLFKLKGMMATESGRRLAERRDAVTRAFLDEFLLEWAGER